MILKISVPEVVDIFNEIKKRPGKFFDIIRVDITSKPNAMAWSQAAV